MKLPAPTGSLLYSRQKHQRLFAAVHFSTEKLVLSTVPGVMIFKSLLVFIGIDAKRDGMVVNSIELSSKTIYYHKFC